MVRAPTQAECKRDRSALSFLRCRQWCGARPHRVERRDRGRVPRSLTSVQGTCPGRATPACRDTFRPHCRSRRSRSSNACSGSRPRCRRRSAVTARSWRSTTSSVRALPTSTCTSSHGVARTDCAGSSGRGSATTRMQEADDYAKRLADALAGTDPPMRFSRRCASRYRAGRGCRRRTRGARCVDTGSHSTTPRRRRACRRLLLRAVR